MRVILDTNVLIGALISPHGVPERIYRAWRAGRFELITSHEQLDELRRVSRYPKLRAILPSHRVITIINHMQRAVVLEHLPPLTNDIQTNDPNDVFLLRMALTADADFLVTGDHRAGLLERRRVGRTHVLTPAEFNVPAL